MKYFHFLLAALFFYFAYLQLNDPDPLYWVVIYGGTAVVILSNALQQRSDFWAAIVIGGIFAGMLVSLPGFIRYLTSGEFGSISDDMLSADYIESAREFLGLLIALCALLFSAKKQCTSVDN